MAHAFSAKCGVARARVYSLAATFVWVYALKFYALYTFSAPVSHVCPCCGIMLDCVCKGEDISFIKL